MSLYEITLFIILFSLVSFSMGQDFAEWTRKNERERKNEKRQVSRKKKI